MSSVVIGFVVIGHDNARMPLILSINTSANKQPELHFDIVAGLVILVTVFEV
jgi:hypothetical protein